MRTRPLRGRGHARNYEDFRHGRTAWPCVYCDHVSVSEAEVKRHMRTHPRETRIKTCETCGQVFVNRGQAYVGHLKSHRSAEERFWEKVAKTDGCWVWVGCRDRKGYGRFGFEQKVWFSHRWLWEQLNPPVPAGHDLDHLCENTSCVNPAHLEVVTHAENIRRARGICPHCGLDTNRGNLKRHIRRRHGAATERGDTA